MIQGFITDWTPTNNAILTALNAPSVANPTPQPTVAKPFAFADVMGCLSAASVANVRSLATATQLITAINLRDVVSIGNWLAALSSPPALITSGEAAAVGAVITATELDPSWPAQISWAAANLGRPATLADVIAARPQGS